MKLTKLFGALAAVASLSLAVAPVAGAGAAIVDPMPPDSIAKRAVAAPSGTEPAQFRESRASGPRVGFTFAPADDEAYRTASENGLGRVVSQFGWHFEHEFAPAGGGPQFFTQVVPLFGGVEYGKFIPTLTLAVGIRLPSGTEFGVGPSFTLVNAEGQSKAGLMIGVGRSLEYSGVSIPLNLAVTTNNEGTRVTLLAGYAIRRASR